MSLGWHFIIFCILCRRTHIVLAFDCRIAPHSGQVYIVLSTTSHEIEVPLAVGFDGYRQRINVTIPTNISTGGDYVILR